MSVTDSHKQGRPQTRANRAITWSVATWSVATMWTPKDCTLGRAQTFITTQLTFIVINDLGGILKSQRMTLDYVLLIFSHRLD